MLVLSRKTGESVFLEIGPAALAELLDLVEQEGTARIQLVILRVDCNRVRLGIQAPKAISIAREELVRKDEGGRSVALNPDPMSGMKDESGSSSVDPVASCELLSASGAAP